MTPLASLDLTGIRILDGGMATELEKLGCDLSGPLWSAHVLREQPETVAAVHESYIEAGAQIILTASYQVSAEAYAEIGLTAEDAAAGLRESVEIAERVRSRHRDRGILIAASLGPYGAALHNGAEYHGNYDLSFDELVAFHARRIAVLASTNADLIAFETVPSLEEARAIVAALDPFPEIAAWVTFTCRDETSTAHGEPIADCGWLLDPIPQIVAVGINCTAPAFVTPLIRALKASTAKPIVIYPNSGEGWDAVTRTWTGIADAALFADSAHEWRQAGAQIIGGCCRTGPEHVRAIAVPTSLFPGPCSSADPCDNKDTAMNLESPPVTFQSAAPAPTQVTPELLAQHSITAQEYEKILAALGRVPSLTELGIYSVMWSEHCSYKSSKVHLKRLPTKSDRVVQGPGENAGIIDVGDGWGCAFKIESHNHPSYIEPYQGAATGVGGILRDIFTMNARPLAVMDSLRFGPISPEESPETDPELIRKNHSIMEGVVSGIAGYGNCFGVPNLGGETRFEPCYSGNPLVNAFALGLVRLDEIFYAKATGVGNPVIYVGAKTGRDGIHGATMASEEFKEGSEQKRPNVQMGDPFMEKLLLEACLEAMRTGAVLGIQDMGAAGLTCSTCEMGARGGVGVEIELDHIPQRATGMTSYEIMLSESQERMLLVAEKGREDEVLRVFAKWGLDATIAGEVVAENRMRVRHHGELVADIPNESLTDDAPLYHRPVGTWKAPVPLDPPAEVLAELSKPRDYTADLKKLLASSNICSKRWVFEQYDSMVQTNTLQGPGGEAGVMRIKGTNRGLAMALDGNSRWCYLDPKLGAMHAVAEAARKVACTGATPVAATNCLNFGNPEKPEIMAQLSAAIDGIGEACTALGTPITGGNVSLYNETRGEGIYPTPVIGIVGIIDDVTKAVPASLQSNDELILIIGEPSSRNDEELRRELGSSRFASTVLNRVWGKPPSLDLKKEAALHGFLQRISKLGLISSAVDVSDGGIAVALAKLCLSRSVAIHTDLSGWKWASQGPSDVVDVPSDGIATECALFGEHSSMVLVSGSARNIGEVIFEAQKAGLPTYPGGTIVPDSNELTISNQNPWAKDDALELAVAIDLDEIKILFFSSLERQLTTEVHA